MNPTFPFKWFAFLLPVSMLIICLIIGLPHIQALQDFAYLTIFRIQFLSIFLEAVPFVLLGALLSALIHLIMPENFLTNKMPKNPLLAIGLSCGLGFLFPICECSMVPLIRRLVQKGMPIYAATAFLLSGPIVNPIVFSATMVAFRGYSEMVYARLGIALFVAIGAGLIIKRFVRHNPLRHTASTMAGHTHESITWRSNISLNGKISAFFQHASDDFLDAAKFLIIGCAITASMQTFIPHETLDQFGSQAMFSYIFMMGLSFVLSLCSTSDAFIAFTFMHSFSKGSLLSFLVLGPMLDIKNMMMLFSAFKAKFVITLLVLVPILVFLGSILTDSLIL